MREKLLFLMQNLRSLKENQLLLSNLIFLLIVVNVPNKPDLRVFHMNDLFIGIQMKKCLGFERLSFSTFYSRHHIVKLQ